MSAAPVPNNADNVLPIYPSKMTVSVVMVTPDMAARWLEQNTSNRPLRDVKVRQYARDMSAGLWTFDASAICFGPDGRLLNGQHRLSAVIASKATIAFQVARNVPESSMKNMDTGTKRTAGDYFGLAGMKHANLIASSAKLASLLADGRVYSDRKVQTVSTTELDVFVDENPDLLTWVETATHLRNIEAPPTAIAVSGWLFARASDSQSSADFLNKLATRSNLGDGHPILTLDNRLRSIRSQRRRVEHRDYIHLFVKAWNYHRKGMTVAQINLPKTGDRIPEVRR